VSRRQHRSEVAVERRDGKGVVGTKPRYGTHVACGRHSFDTVHIPYTFNNAAGDRLFTTQLLLLLLLLLMMMIVALKLRRIDSNYFEAVHERITAESYLYFTIHIRNIFGVGYCEICSSLLT